MAPGTPQARWIRSERSFDWTTPVLEQMACVAFTNCRIVSVEPLTGGFRNANFKLQLDCAPEPVVLRISQHDPSLCAKELDLMRLVGRSAPVPELIHAEPDGLPPFILMRYVEGVTFRELRRSGDATAMTEAAYSVGATLAAIGRYTFPGPGWLGPGPTVTAPILEGDNPMPRFVDLCLASPNVAQRMPGDLRDRTGQLVWSYAQQLDALNTARLVHGDFSNRNLIVAQSNGRWSVAAVLDWEFAVSGSPLADIGSFLRYERAGRPRAEPHFSTAYVNAGGLLPDNWRRLARVLDLTALCESLTRIDLPETVTAEIVELVRATVEDRDADLR